MKKLLTVFLSVLAGLAVGAVLFSPAAHLLAGGGAPALAPALAMQNGDVNGDGRRDISDAIYLLRWLFSDGPAPVPVTCPAVCPAERLPATGEIECYGDGVQGNVIPCDSQQYPGQDGFYQQGCPLGGRFVDNGDGTVADKCTGLVWQKKTAEPGPQYEPSATGGVTWANALQYCENLGFSGRTEWRLPNVRELQSIVVYGQAGRPATDPLFDVQAAEACCPYWTSTTFDGTTAWVVDLGKGITVPENKGGKVLVRAVRGP